MCCALMGSDKKIEADSENLSADSVVKYVMADGRLLFVFTRSAISGCRKR